MSDSVIRPDGQPERRRANRAAALRLKATVRRPGCSRVAVRVIDISTHGCRIEGAPADADSWVLLSIAGLETQYCRVVWGCQEFCGVEFATPLAEAVLDTLLQGQKRLAETTVTVLRDIAKRTHRLAARQADGDTEILSELSRQCAVDAVIEGLRLSEAGQAASADAAKRP